MRRHVFWAWLLALIIALTLSAISLARGRPAERESRSGGISAGRPPSPPAPNSRSADRPPSYPVDWRRRYQREHRLATRLGHRVRKLQRRVRTLQISRLVETRDGGYWAARQIAAAEVLGREGDSAGTDPWPNCPDPYDHAGASWQDTLACENPEYGWVDSPGYYRCGLQFDPMWERRFGRLCP